MGHRSRDPFFVAGLPCPEPSASPSRIGIPREDL
jgi:hypothetical protein